MNYQQSIARSEDFIQTRHIPEGICDAILEYYEKNEQSRLEGQCITDDEKGKHSALVLKDVKESTDIAISPNNWEQPFMDYRLELQKCLDEYVNTYPAMNNLNRFNVLEDYNIQHYPKGGGFKIEHFERDGGFNKTIRRCLVFMTYLNDLDDGGTRFVYQKRIVKAQKGKTVIFPVDWTHTHASQISHTQEKTIVTGWFSFKWGSAD